MTNSSSDDGLPLPNVPYHLPPVPGRKPVPDSTGCTPVKDLLAAAREVASEPTERWNDEFPAAAAAASSNVPEAPVPKPRIDAKGQDATPSYFKRRDRTIEKFGDGPIDAGEAFLTFVFHPITTATSDIYSARINAWQQEFIKDHRLQLESMTRAMSRIEDFCEALRNVVHQAPPMDPRIDQIMKEKETLGDKLVKEIEDCLRRSTPGPERDRLETLWKQVRDWMADRDARVEADRRDVARLRGAIDGLQREATALDMDLRAAATQAYRMRVAAQGAPLAHANPEAAMFAIKLRAYLMATRQRLDDAATPA